VSADAVERLNAALRGRYRIESELGEGGMAMVYLADDLKHERKVALKVLKAELAAVVGAERFLAEIKTTANLQHPHILPLFDSGEADGFLYYVMPYVEGESLRDRLDSEKQLPVDEAVRIAADVAEALHAAHERGVIHRDIKPANILLQAGKPVLSDFGIALAVGAAGGGRLTETGLSLGTPHYMSPEQATGDLSVSAPTDIYALGCVLYEMLVGEPPYTGSTAQAVLGKIVTGNAEPVTKLRPSVPENVDAAIRRALEKVPADRFGSAKDFARATADPGFRHEVGGGAVRPTPIDQGPWKRVALALGSTTVLALAGLGIALFGPSAPDPVARYAVQLPSGHDITDVYGSSLTIAPDGSAIVYVGPGEGGSGQQLWLRRRDALLPTPLAGTEDSSNPVFSPDGESIAFVAGLGEGLRIVSVRGGPSIEILTGRVSRAGGLSWSDDGHIYLAGEGLLRVPESGGPVEVLVPEDVSETILWPEALPDGRGVLFTTRDGLSASSAPRSEISVFDSESGSRRMLLEGELARYTRSGHILYAGGDGALSVVPFNVRSLELTGRPAGITTGLPTRLFAGAHDLDVSQYGTLVYVAQGGDRDEYRRPVWVSRDGVAQPVDTAWTWSWIFPALAPDGSRVAVTRTRTGGPSEVWIKELDAGPATRLTLDPAGGERPSWTPDGEAVMFSSARGGNPDRWTRRADGGGQAELTLDVGGGVTESLWSPEGDWLVYRDGGAGIWAVPTSPGGRAVKLVEPEARISSLTMSPDGRFLAYSSAVTGESEVYVVSFPEVASGRWQISTGGGTESRWSPVGDEIFFRDGAGNMVTVPVQMESGFNFAGPRILFPASGYLASGTTNQMYDVSPDGQRFFMAERPSGAGTSQLILVENLFEVLRERFRSP
jgi:serine/threonine-protein kinase